MTARIQPKSNWQDDSCSSRILWAQRQPSQHVLTITHSHCSPASSTNTSHLFHDAVLCAVPVPLPELVQLPDRSGQQLPLIEQAKSVRRRCMSSGCKLCSSVTELRPDKSRMCTHLRVLMRACVWVGQESIKCFSISLYLCACALVKKTHSSTCSWSLASRSHTARSTSWQTAPTLTSWCGWRSVARRTSRVVRLLHLLKGWVGVGPGVCV